MKSFNRYVRVCVSLTAHGVNDSHTRGGGLRETFYEPRGNVIIKFNRELRALSMGVCAVLTRAYYL